MIRLLKIESKKILSYKLFWTLTGLYFIFLTVGVILAEIIINNMINGANKNLPIPLPHVNMYFFPDIWQNITFFASLRYVLIFPAIVIIILITNEFTFKTIRQNVVTGMSKKEFLVSKLLLIVVLSLVITLFVMIGAFILGLLHSDAAALETIWHKFSFIPGFFVQTFTFLVFAFFLGFILRNTGLSIAIFVLYTFIVEPILSGITKIPSLKAEWVSQYLPVNSALDVIKYPYIPILKKLEALDIQEYVSLTNVAAPLLYAAIMIGIVFWDMSRKDL